ncbi:hypothetical protein Tco_0432449 [Tanacetum coccineum]
MAALKYRDEHNKWVTWKNPKVVMIITKYLELLEGFRNLRALELCPPAVIQATETLKVRSFLLESYNRDVTSFPSEHCFYNTTYCPSSLQEVSGLVLHMFVDKKYPLSVSLIERMLDHQLEIYRGTVGNELTTAVQLIAFLKKQISDSKRPKVPDRVMKVAALVFIDKAVIFPYFSCKDHSPYIIQISDSRMLADSKGIPTGSNNKGPGSIMAYSRVDSKVISDK